MFILTKLLRKKLINITLLVFAFCFISCTGINQGLQKNDLPAKLVCPNSLNKNSAPKKIMIIYNRSGGGHVSASKSLAKILGKDYCLQFVNFNDRVFVEIFGFSPDRSYNKMLQEGNFEKLNHLAKKYLPLLFKGLYWPIKAKFKKLVKQDPPDLIISTIPLVNNVIVNTANDLKIPAIMTFLDHDVSNWSFGLKPSMFENHRVFLTVGWIAQSEMNKLILAGIKKEQIYQIGNPLREQFKKNYDKDEARKAFNIPKDKFVITVMLGGTASDSMFDIAGEINKLKNNDLHVIFVAGNNTEVKQKLEEEKFPNNISKTVLGYVENMAELMGASDLLILKSGPQSIYEASQMGVPMIIDISHGTMTHEKATVQFVKTNNLGLLLTKLEQLNKNILFMMNKKNYNNFKKNFEKIPQNNFDEEFKKLVDKVLR